MRKISILGDSISTLDGFNPDGYKVFYAEANCDRAEVRCPKDTWWGQVIEHLNGELLINNSWSGSRVSMMPSGSLECLFPSGCSDERTNSLHTNEDKPELIIIYLGTNDWAYGVLVEDYSDDFPLPAATIEHYKSFEGSYSEMLCKVTRNYPNAEVWCCTLCETVIEGKPSFRFPHTYAGTHIEQYNGVIRRTAQEFGCKVIDLYNMHMPYDSLDGTHPTARGMRTIASMVIKAMEETEVNPTVECENNRHEYIVAEAHTGYTRYVCKKCGKEKYWNSLAPETDIITTEPKENPIGTPVGSEYVILDPEKTTLLYSDTLEL